MKAVNQPGVSSALPRAASGWLAHAQRRPLEAARRTLTYLVLLSGSVIFVLPLMWMFTTSLKTQQEVFTFPPTFIPHTWRWQNYPDAWNYPGMAFGQWGLNTIFITAFVVAGILVTSSFCAYGFARIRFPGRDFWFMAILASMMLPSQVTLIPLYIVFYRIGWLDSFKPLIVPAWLGGGAFFIFMLRQFFMQIPPRPGGCRPDRRLFAHRHLVAHLPPSLQARLGLGSHLCLPG